MTQMAESGVKPLTGLTAQEARAQRTATRQRPAPGPEVGAVTEGGTIPVRIFSPAGAPQALIVYYHGGGWVLGTLDEFDALARHLVNRTGATVVLVDYRLAPEHRYPVAAQDAWTALRWVDAYRGELAGARVPLIVSGDSAGGNLSAIVVQRAKADGFFAMVGVLPCAAEGLGYVVGQINRHLTAT
jgi:acetyl esterase